MAAPRPYDALCLHPHDNLLGANGPCCGRRPSPAMSSRARTPAGPAPKPRRKRKAAPKPAPLRPPHAKLSLTERLGPTGRAVLWALASLGALASVLGVALVVGYGRSKVSTGSKTVDLDWPAGLGADEAAELLESHGLIESRRSMSAFLRATGGAKDFVPGPHLLSQGATPWELRTLLSRSLLRRSVRVTIPEGFHRFDIGARLEKLRVASKRAFVAASADGALLEEVGIEKGGSVGAESAEGYLFPATYDLQIDSEPREIVRRLVREADKRWDAIATQSADGLASLRGSLGWGRREVVTLASVIEKEAVVDDERPLIASVFLNRLTSSEFLPKHRLQSDPTASYGCIAFPAEAPSCATFAGKPTPAVNADPKNRYSTYAHGGLPPGPICSPSSKSIAAVLAPAATRFLYFVAAGGGRHTFSETFDAHSDAVRKLRSATHP